jgi:uncharacterized protein (DUF169 family)
MALVKKDLAVLDRLALETPPVGIKFSAKPPGGIPQLAENLALCEMLCRAQAGQAFFAAAENQACEAGSYVLGQSEAPEPYISGEFGAGLGLFAEPRTAARLYHDLPRVRPGIVRYVTLAPLTGMTFDPDVLVIMAETGPTEILLRAASYQTGQPWTSRFAPAIGCSWIMVYPYLTGRLNYVLTGLGHGMRRRRLFPEGRQLISIPFDLLPGLLQSLKEMPWELPAFRPDGEAFVRKLVDRLGLNKNSES